jgi:hypothetical protein
VGLLIEDKNTIQDNIWQKIIANDVENAIDYINSIEFTEETYNYILSEIVTNIYFNTERAKILNYYINMDGNFYDKYNDHCEGSPFVTYLTNNNSFDFLTKTFAQKGESLLLYEIYDYDDNGNTIEGRAIDYMSDMNSLISFIKNSTSNEQILLNLATDSKYGFKFVSDLNKELDVSFLNDISNANDDIELYKANKQYKKFKEQTESFKDLVKTKIEELNSILLEP